MTMYEIFWLAIGIANRYVFIMLINDSIFYIVKNK